MNIPRAEEILLLQFKQKNPDRNPEEDKKAAIAFQKRNVKEEVQAAIQEGKQYVITVRSRVLYKEVREELQELGYTTQVMAAPVGVVTIIYW